MRLARTKNIVQLKFTLKVEHILHSQILWPDSNEINWVMTRLLDVEALLLLGVLEAFITLENALSA